MSLFGHYRNLLFFARHRFEHDNYARMREYFAQVVIDEVTPFISLQDARILDVGGGQGEFCRVLSRQASCAPVNLDPSSNHSVWPNSVAGVGQNLPFPDSQFDLVLCRGVLEHIPPEGQVESLREMRRVLKAGGIAYVMIPPWYGFHAGHHLKPFHLLPFPLAKRLRQLFFRNTIKGRSYAEETLYPITFRRMARLLEENDLETVAMKDTHLRLHWMTHVPLLREVLVPAVAFIARK